MRPKLLNELDQQGYVEVYKEQIKEYLRVKNGSCYLFMLGKDNIGNNFELKKTFDYKEEIIEGRSWFLPTREVKYTKTSDLYYYNTHLKIYFNEDIINQIEDDMEVVRQNKEIEMFDRFRKTIINKK